MIWIIALTLLGMILFHEMYWKCRNYPPGPTPLPLIGNLIPIMLDFPGINVYKKWKAQYGPIYTYWFGTKPFVTVNDYRLVYEMFVNDGDTYADRSSFGDFMEKYRGGTYGVIESSGAIWRDQRRFTLHTLRDFGLGKEEMQERIIIEADWLLRKLEEESLSGGSCKPLKYMDRTVASVINLVLFGYRFDEKTEANFYRIRDLLDEQNKALSNPIIILFFVVPTLGEYIPYIKGKLNVLYKTRDALYEFFEQNIKEHRNSIDFESDHCNDICDAYLREMHRTRDDPNSSFNDKQLVNVCLDLWIAGMETTASTMAWGIILLINHPHVLAKLHDEYDSVIGRERLISMKDKNDLPCTNAFINEVQRWANIIPQNLLRCTNKDVEIEGVQIKKGTAISPQISVLMFDPEVFPDPDKFDPDRFIDDDGKVKQYKEFLPFSIGRRQCLGEGLAKMELFLFFSNLIHRFDITACDPSDPPSMKRIFASSQKPAAFDCKITKRTMRN